MYMSCLIVREFNMEGGASSSHVRPAPHRVAMVCDFFYPSAGGVENHVHQLAQCLLRQGHKVIVITHKYGARQGVRWLAGGLKVYHVPFASVYDRCLMPTVILMLPLLRDILARERISVVHTHAVCTMALEAVPLAALMGYRVVHTEHSNFGFAGAVDIHLNKLEQYVLSHADNVISVSHTSKENVALRCRLDPTEVFVIPNAVDATQFRPDPDNVRPRGCVNVVVMTRLVWRKGTHLLVQLIPEVRARS
jgi:phosphatidylinositol glycan class A protein